MLDIPLKTLLPVLSPLPVTYLVVTRQENTSEFPSPTLPSYVPDFTLYSWNPATPSICSLSIYTLITSQVIDKMPDQRPVAVAGTGAGAAPAEEAPRSGFQQILKSVAMFFILQTGE
jgi:hypothetical protein